ncbi:MAG: ADP-ribosylglycohydrolase family protein [Spirochaetia bacterium]|nr:ADP-ribosylglycohydrolase family protein [Spirochaetia bacterium]
MNKQKYLEQVYAGLLGMCAGVRLGAPVEPTIWTYERIKKTYGDIRGYVKNYSNFAADDDVNGPVFFIRSLMDFKPPLSAEKVGQSWLNYTREGIGFYWWGGYGRSTEHTAYLNLKNGITAPDSGSIKVNGKAIAEQIGGQIFIDSWGLVTPDNYKKAAEYASMAASVGHDGNGIYGAVFVAALISMAFSRSDVPEMIEDALELIPNDSNYVRVVKSVRDFYLANPNTDQDDWRACRDFLASDFGYDKYPGVCHIIPNSGVIALALYYGRGDFARTIEIATMSGWDTDCNAGNVGTILGVMAGPEGIPDKYSGPINDFHAASSISGALNILDLPTVSKELAILGLNQLEDSIPDEWKKSSFTDDIYFDFTIPGTTHGIRTSSDYLTPLRPDNPGERRVGKVTFILDRIKRDDESRIFYKPYYRRDDFDDERYSPTFTPTVFPGQVMHIEFMVEKFSGQGISIAPYVRDSSTKEIFAGKEIFPESEKDFTVDWTLPDVPFAVDEAGLLVRGIDKEKFLGEVNIYKYSISGKKSFNINFVNEKKEFGGLSRCSLSGGSWSIEKENLHVITNEIFQLYTGSYYTRDYTVEVKLTPEYGDSHLLAFRSIGAERAYFFGLSASNKVALIKRDHTNIILSEKDFPWKIVSLYTLKVEAVGGSIRCFIDGKVIINFEDKDFFPSGMVGLGKLAPGRTLYKSISFSEIR